MASRWNLYFTAVNDQPAWIEVDLSFAQSVRGSEYPFLFMVAVSVREPDAEGFPGINEVVLLDAYELTLISALEFEQACVVVGRVTSEGQRQLFAYAKTEAFDPQQVLEKTWVGEAAFVTRVTDLTEDPEWQYYDEFLLPNAEERQQMVNRQMIDQLRKSGVLESDQMLVTHLVEFPSVSACELFLDVVKDLGYQEIEKEQLGESDRWQVRVARTEKMELQAICEVTFYVMDVADAYEGTYVSWEAEKPLN